MLLITVWRYRKMQAKESGRSSVLVTQLKLAVTACIISINLMLVMVFTTLMTAGGQYFNIYYFIYKIVIDIFYQCNPYLLLLCSSPLRSAFLKLIRCSAKQPNLTTTNTQNNIPSNIRIVRHSIVSVHI